MKALRHIGFFVGILAGAASCSAGSSSDQCSGRAAFSCVASCFGTELEISAVCSSGAWECPSNSFDLATCDCTSSFPVSCCDHATAHRIGPPKCVAHRLTCDVGTLTDSMGGSEGCGSIPDAGSFDATSGDAL